MDLDQTRTKAESKFERLGAAKTKAGKEAHDKRLMKETDARIIEKELPFVRFSQAFQRLESSLPGNQDDRTRNQLQIKVDKANKGKSLYLTVDSTYHMTGDDGDGGPTGREFGGWRFIASVGIEVSREEYTTAGLGTDNDVQPLGITTDGKYIVGSEVDSEVFGQPTTYYRDVAAFERREACVDEYHDSLMQTVELIKAGLANQRWNPRKGNQIPPELTA